MLEIRTPDGHVTVPAGEQCSFGRGLDIVDLVLTDDRRVHRHAGTAVVDEDSWTLHNDGRWLRLRVTALDRRAFDVLEPGSVLRVPWDRARVDIVVGTDTIGFEAHHHGLALPAPRPLAVDPGDARTAIPRAIARDSGAFRALLALCEPRLTESGSDDLPTNQEIALRLNRSGVEERRVTAKTVERRLDYCRRRLELKGRAEQGSNLGVDHRALRRQLIEAALMAGLVGVADLELLRPAEDEPERPGATT